MYERKIVWDKELADSDSEGYFTLAYEANRAVSLSSLHFSKVISQSTYSSNLE